MLEISEHLINILKYDATITSLTGATSSDYRIYSWKPSFDIFFSSTYEAAIFYSSFQDKRPPSWSYPNQIGNITYFFQSSSLSKTKAIQIIERINDLFDKYSFSTDNFNVLSVMCNGKKEGPLEGSPTRRIYGETISFLLRDIISR